MELLIARTGCDTFILTDSKEKVMRRIIMFFLIAVFVAAGALAQAPYPYRALDPKQFDPAVDPDIDMFINHWSNSVPRLMYGSMVFRDVLTGLEGKDSLHPTKKGAVLLEQTAISYATIEPGAIASGKAKEKEQQIFYVAGGTGDITAGDKSYNLKEGMGFILTPEFDFKIVGAGNKQLSFYVVTEPLPAGFKANKSLVVKNRFDGNKTTGAHWAHIGNGIISSGDGVANYSGLSLITIDARTIPHPHSHGQGIEECWIMVKGETMLLLGKQLRRCPAGTIYRIPSSGLTAHTNINLGDEPVQMIHMMKSVPGETKEFAMLDPAMYDPKTEPDIDMFMGNWRNSTPRLMHGNLVFRDMLTTLEGPDDLHPSRRGACLTYSEAVSYATIEPGAVAHTMKGELNNVQQTFVVHSGEGVITSGSKTVELKKGMAFIITPGLDFKLTATGDSCMTFYVATEKILAGFSPNKTLEVVDNRGEAPFMKVHWANIDRVMVGQKNGMCQYSAFTEVKLDAMTIAQPHSHEKGVEEIWIATDGDIELLLGKQLRKLPVGTAYRIPSTGKTAHSNINATDDMVKLIHMMKVPK
jgi:mannose-6-phosphate isomerase-like protein (cupin superfamily)